jgi:hypothetical protein
MYGPKTLLNPFDRYTERQLLLVGVAAFVVGSFIAYCFDGRFDGVVDLHFMQQVAWYGPFLDNLINLVCVLVPLFLLGKYINRKTRIIDLITAFLISRIPYFVLPLFNINGYMHRITEELMNSAREGVMNNSTVPELPLSGMEMTLLLVFAGLSILAVIWSIILLYNGFKTATNAKTVGHQLLFAVALIAAEVLSKMVILKMITNP